MSVIGEAALSVFLELLIDKLVSSALSFVKDHKEVRGQLKVWQSRLPYIQAVLNDAEEKQIKGESVKRWLADLQDLAYDVDDILDEFAYEVLRLKPQQSQASTSKARKLIPACCTSHFTPTAFVFNNEMIAKIKKITGRLDDLAEQKRLLGLKEIGGGASSKGKKGRLQPTSVVDEAHAFYGREKEKLEILEFLKSGGGGGGVSVISVVGMGGLGKTTLAQLVYNDSSIKNSFDHKAWVCVSDDFDPVRITKTILKSISSESCHETDLNLLQVKLKETLYGKRFLLILHDVIRLERKVR